MERDGVNEGTQRKIMSATRVQSIAVFSILTVIAGVGLVLAESRSATVMLIDNTMGCILGVVVLLLNMGTGLRSQGGMAKFAFAVASLGLGETIFAALNIFWGRF